MVGFGLYGFVGLVNLVWFCLVLFGFVWFGFVWFGWCGLVWPAYEHHGGAVGVPLAPVLFAHPENGGPPAETTNYATSNYANLNLYNL